MLHHPQAKVGLIQRKSGKSDRQPAMIDQGHRVFCCKWRKRDLSVLERPRHLTPLRIQPAGSLPQHSACPAGVLRQI